jgi:hypothetical protein
MSKESHPHSLSFTDAHRRQFEQIATLLELEDWNLATVFSAELALRCAKARARGNTHVHFCTPKLAEVLSSNPEFIEALCKEGVVEWLTPFVLTKSKQFTFDPHQP